MFGHQRVGNLGHIAVHNEIDFVQGEIDAVIGDAALRKIIGADALGTIAGADQRFTLCGLFGVLFALLLILDASNQN